MTSCFWRALIKYFRFELITRNLQEYLGGDRIKAVLEERDLNVYWGKVDVGKVEKYLFYR